MITPINYYGGKKNLASRIIELIPGHKLYVEPFMGGGAVFFKKQKSQLECINDLNKNVVNFYKILQQEFVVLKMLVEQTCLSRSVHKDAVFILRNPEAFTDIRRAWAFWMQVNFSYAAILDGSYSYSKSTDIISSRIVNKKLNFNESLKQRLDRVDIECSDALKVIKSRDSNNTFYYIDPPYINCDMAHYGGYSENDFEKLLLILSKIKGKFILSSYKSDILNKFTVNNNWNTINIDSICSASHKKKELKTEVLTMNY